MESFLKDTPLEDRDSTGDFRAFLEPEPVQEVNTSEDDKQSSEDPSAETEIPDESQEISVDTPEEQNVTEESPESISEEVVEPPAEETNSVQESPSDVPPPSTVAGTGEIVFEQVDGPKVEVISEDGEVTKIVVHLAPDKILEINCEY